MASRSSTISAGGLRVGLQEQLHEQSFDRLRVVADLVIARRLPDAAVLQPVQRRFAGKHRTVLPLRRQALREKRQHRIMAKRVMVVDVLVSQGDCRDALPDQRAHAVDRSIRIAAIDEAGGHPVEQADRAVDVAKQKAPASEVMAPPSKPATTLWPSKPSNSSCPEIQSVCIGPPP